MVLTKVRGFPLPFVERRRLLDDLCPHIGDNTLAFYTQKPHGNWYSQVNSRCLGLLPDFDYPSAPTTISLASNSFFLSLCSFHACKMPNLSAISRMTGINFWWYTCIRKLERGLCFKGQSGVLPCFLFCGKSHLCGTISFLSCNVSFSVPH